MTDDDEQDFKQAKECHICEEKYGEKDIRVISFYEPKVHNRDRCHTYPPDSDLYGGYY